MGDPSEIPNGISGKVSRRKALASTAFSGISLLGIGASSLSATASDTNRKIDKAYHNFDDHFLEFEMMVDYPETTGDNIPPVGVEWGLNYTQTGAEFNLKVKELNVKFRPTVQNTDSDIYAYTPVGEGNESNDNLPAPLPTLAETFMSVTRIGTTAFGTALPLAMEAFSERGEFDEGFTNDRGCFAEWVNIRGDTCGGMRVAPMLSGSEYSRPDDGYYSFMVVVTGELEITSMTTHRTVEIPEISELINIVFDSDL